MSAIVNTNGEQPWRQGGRTTETFRSGLIKVTDVYLTPTTSAQTDAAAFALGTVITGVTQSVDDVKVYPEPQIIDQGDGFSRIVVTGYGRLKTSPTTEPRLEAAVGYEIVIDGDGNQTSENTLTLTRTAFVCRYIIMDDEDPTLDFSALESQVRLYDSTGAVFPLLRTGWSLTLAKTFAFSDSTYYGNFTEVVTVIQYTPTWTRTE